MSRGAYETVTDGPGYSDIGERECPSCGTIPCCSMHTQQQTADKWNIYNLFCIQADRNDLALQYNHIHFISLYTRLCKVIDHKGTKHGQVVAMTREPTG